MAGVLAGTIFGTYFADKIGRRRSLVMLALLTAVGGALLVATDALWAVALAAFFGMLNTQGSDRGAAQALEQAILPATATDAERTMVFARYNAIADVGGAAGALLAALPALLRDRLHVAELHAYDSTVLVYAALALIVAWLYSRLSSRVESAPLPRAGRSRARCAAQHSARGPQVFVAVGARCGRRRIHRLGADRLLSLRALRCQRSRTRAAVRRGANDDGGCRTSPPRGLRSASVSSTRWCSRTFRRVCCC